VPEINLGTRANGIDGSARRRRWSPLGRWCRQFAAFVAAGPRRGLRRRHVRRHPVRRPARPRRGRDNCRSF